MIVDKNPHSPANGSLSPCIICCAFLAVVVWDAEVRTLKIHHQLRCIHGSARDPFLGRAAISLVSIVLRGENSSCISAPPSRYFLLASTCRYQNHAHSPRYRRYHLPHLFKMNTCHALLRRHDFSEFSPYTALHQQQQSDQSVRHGAPRLVLQSRNFAKSSGFWAFGLGPALRRLQPHGCDFCRLVSDW